SSACRECGEGFSTVASHSDEISDCLTVAQLSVLLAYLSFRTVEKYFIRKNLLKALMFISLMFASSTILIIYPNTPLPISPRQRARSSITTFLSGGDTNVTVEKTLFESNCFAFRHQDYRPKVVTSSMLQNARVANEYFVKYLPNHSENSPPDPLMDKHFKAKNINVYLSAYHKNSGDVSIAVFGNSYAHRAFGAIIAATGQRAKEMRLLSMPGCPPFIGSSYREVPGIDCSPFLNASVELIEEMRPDITFLIFRPLPPLILPIIDLSNDDHFNNIQYTIDRISAVTKRIIIEYPLPVDNSRSVTPFLLQRLQKAQISFDDLKMDYSFFWNKTKYTFKRLDSVKCSNCDRIYTHKLLCDFEVCRVFDPENLYSFFDKESHYNDYAMKCFEKVYREIIDENFANGVIG
uniref:SGNH domain-containing protein n=1 Tax=Parascaris univalens TaxID=6257 RepID=A0A915BV72_PARUN